MLSSNNRSKSNPMKKTFKTSCKYTQTHTYYIYPIHRSIDNKSRKNVPFALLIRYISTMISPSHSQIEIKMSCAVKTCAQFLELYYFSYSFLNFIFSLSAVLEDHRKQCEAEGKYVEAEMAKNRIEELKI